MTRSKRVLTSAFGAALVSLVAAYAVAQQGPGRQQAPRARGAQAPSAQSAAPEQPPDASGGAACPCPYCPAGQGAAACGAPGAGPHKHGMKGGGCPMCGAGGGMGGHPMMMAKDLELDVKVEKTKQGAVLRVNAKNAADAEKAQRIALMIALHLGADASALLPASGSTGAK